MSEIARFEMDTDGSMVPDGDGGWVRYDDVFSRIPFAYVWTNSKGRAEYGPEPSEFYPSEPLYK